jgi:hypothetical protein
MEAGLTREGCLLRRRGSAPISWRNMLSFFALKRRRKGFVWLGGCLRFLYPPLCDLKWPFECSVLDLYICVLGVRIFCHRKTVCNTTPKEARIFFKPWTYLPYVLLHSFGCTTSLSIRHRFSLDWAKSCKSESVGLWLCVTESETFALLSMLRPQPHNFSVFYMWSFSICKFGSSNSSPNCIST